MKKQDTNIRERVHQRESALSSACIRGFTLVEMIIVLFIITTISTLILVNYRQKERKLALQNAIQQLALNVRRAQNMALQAANYPEAGPNRKIPDAYGIYFNIASSTSYILFADCNVTGLVCDNNNIYDAACSPCGFGENKPERIEQIALAGNIQIFALSPTSSLSITFQPPDPTTCIYNSGGCNATSSTITLRNTITADSVNIIITDKGSVGIQ